MDKLICASCGAEMALDATVCPNCGTEVEIIDSEVDNSEAIAAMLRSAAQMMQDTDIPELPDKDETDDSDAEATIEEFPIEKETISNELSDEQKSKLGKGEIVDLSAMQPQAAKQEPVSLSLDEEAQPEQTPAEIPEIEEISEVAEAPTDEETDKSFATAYAPKPEEVPEAQPEAEENAEKEKPKKEKKIKAQKSPKIKKIKEKIPKAQNVNIPVVNKKISAKTLVATFFMVVILGAAFVFITTLVLRYSPSDDQKFAQNCAKAVLTTFNSDSTLTVCEAYINEKSTEKICLIYGVKNSSVGNGETSWYRVKIDKSAPDKYNVYLPLSNEYYELLRSNGDERDFILASVLKSYDNEMQREISEIQNANSNWKELNAAEVNYYYSDWIAETTTEAEAPEETTEAQTIE